MKKGLTELIAILDASGSMAGPRISDARDGVNNLIEEQKKQPGECQVTIVAFDDRYKVIVDNKSITEVPKLDGTNYYPGGVTALLDAMGRTINSVGARLRDTPEELRPEHVIVIVATDGMENASVEYNKHQVADMVTEQQDKYSWKFIFLGADMDSIADAQAIGIKGTLCYDVNTQAGRQGAYLSASETVTMYRAGADDVDVQAVYDVKMSDDKK